MSTFDESPERRIVPRWREAKVTASTGELQPVGVRQTGAAQIPGVGELEERLAEWRKNRDLAHAADAVSVAVTLGRQAEIEEPARFILRPEMAAPAPARRMARVALGLEERVSTSGSGDESETRAGIRALRARLKDEPRNSIGWIDLARAYTLLGQQAQAIEAMRRALAISPESRFALRSAARLHVHVGDSETALALLRRSPRTPVDPWLLASETAVATILGRGSKFIKAARGLVGSKSMDPRHISELASALGTVELVDGRKKDARLLFEQSLLAPNDNSIAQGEWATRRLPGLRIEPSLLAKPRAFEARAWEAFRNKRWADAFSGARGWHDDEPFSSRPARMGTFVSSVLLEDFASSIRMARRALVASPEDFTLRNNLVFAYGSTGDLERARAEIAQFPDRCIEDDKDRAVWSATRGLVAFRAGEVETGRELYRAAAEALAAAGDPESASFALAYWAREEFEVQSGAAQSILANAIAVAAHAKSDALQEVLARLASLIALGT